MKSSLSLLLSLASAAQVLAATEALHINQTTVTLTDANPPIDATAFVNLAPYEVSIYTTLPYQFTSLRYLTNYGVMLGEPGFLFQYRTNSSTPPKPLSRFENSGIVSASSQMTIYASNVVGGLLLECGDQGYIKIVATNSNDHVDLTGTGLQAGRNPLLDGPSYGTFLTPARTTYINDIGVSDSFWGIGINGSMPGAAGADQYSPATLAYYFSGQGFFGFTNTPSTPFFPYQYITSVGGLPLALSGSTSLPQCGGTFAAYDRITRVTPGNAPNYTEYRQIVFVATNLNDLGVQVEFLSAPGQNRWESSVQFSLNDTNIVDGTTNVSYLTLIDTSLQSTNRAYAQNQLPPFPSATPAAGTFRPNNYQLTRAPYIFFGEIPSTNAFNYNYFYPSNSVDADVDLFHTAYGAGLWQYFPGTVPSNPSPGVTDPTNHPGRIQLFATAINLEQSRIRAENFVGIEARNLYGSPAPMLPQIDAPFINFEFGSTNPVITLSNTLPATVRRFYGQIAAYSATWTVVHTNFLPTVTNVVTTRYHVLFVDNCTQSQPVTLNKFVVHGNGVDLQDPLSIQGNMLLDFTSLTIGPNGGITLPAGWSWGYTNVPRLRSLTNFSTLIIPRNADFQLTNAVRVSIPTNIQGRLTNYWVTNIVNEPYDNIVNHGIITAESATLWSRYFEQTSNPNIQNLIQTSLGPINLNTLTAILDGGQFLANSKITLLASDMTVNRTVLWAGTNNAAGGAIEISVTNSLFDSGPGANNEWHTSQGIQMDRFPLNGGNLLGTTIYSVPTALTTTHTWPGRNLGRTTAGFTNNLALGRLVLDGAPGRKFRFRGAEIDSANQYALYVDYLDLRNGATDFNNAIQFQGTNFIIYFANASVPAKLINEASVGRRLRWVYEYTGALSSTNITVVQTNSYHGLVTNTYTFNIALASNPDLNSDRDDRNNAQDPSPLFTSGDVDLVVSHLAGGNYGLTWWALAYATNQVEYATDLLAPFWLPVTNFVNGPETIRVSITNQAGGALRLYRVRENPYDLIGFPP